MILLTLFSLLKIYSCTHIKKELNETTDIESLILENLHQGTPNILITLGKTLKERMLKPVSDAKLGQEIIEDLFKYYGNLKDVLDMLKSKDAVEKKLGMKLFNALLVSGGPPHMDEDFDMEYVMEKYQWNNKAVFTVRKVLDETDMLWQDIQLEVAKPPEEADRDIQE